MFTGPNIVTEGLVLALDAGNKKSYPGSGTTWTDLSGQGNNGTLVNGVGYDSSNMGALTFDGVNDYIQSNSNFNYGASSRAMCCWFKWPNSTNSDTQGVIRLGTGSDNTLFELLITGDSCNRLLIHFWGSGNFYNVYTNESRCNQWNYFCLSYDNTNVHTFHNGELLDSRAWNLNTGNAKLVLGDPAFSGHTYFSGFIANASVYNRALSASEVLQNYNATKSRFGLT